MWTRVKYYNLRVGARTRVYQIRKRVTLLGSRVEIFNFHNTTRVLYSYSTVHSQNSKHEVHRPFFLVGTTGRPTNKSNLKSPTCDTQQTQ